MTLINFETNLIEVYIYELVLLFFFKNSSYSNSKSYEYN